MRRTVMRGIEIFVLLVPAAVGAVLIPSAWRTAHMDKALVSVGKHELQGNYEEAIRLASQLVAENPGDSTVREVYALALSRGHDDHWLGALRALEGGGVSEPVVRALKEQYRIALSGNPADDACWHNLSWVEWVMGNRGLALWSITQAIQLEPSDPLYRVSAGLFFEANGDEQEAVREYGRAIELSPRILESRFYSELTSRDAALSQESVLTAEVSLRQQLPDPVAGAKLGRVELNLGKTEEAEALITRSLQQLPNLGGAWLSLAALKLRVGSRQEARDDLRKGCYLSHYDPACRHLHELLDKRWIPTNTEGIDQWRPRNGRLPSPHAQRAHSQYRTQNPLVNDMLPEELLHYCSPDSE